jgi:hypothetical protein
MREILASAFNKTATNYEKAQLYRKLRHVEIIPSQYVQPYEQILQSFHPVNRLDRYQRSLIDALFVYYKGYTSSDPFKKAYQKFFEIITEERIRSAIGYPYNYILQEQIQRYFQPLKFLLMLIINIVTPLLGFLRIFLCGTPILIQYVTTHFLNFLINGYTSNYFHQKCTAYKEAQFLEEKIEFISQWKDGLQETTTLSDKEFIDLLKEEVGEDFEEEFDNLVRDRISIAGLRRLTFLIFSMYKMLSTYPTDILSALAWPIRLLTAWPLFLLAVAVELFNLIVDRTSLAAITVTQIIRLGLFAFLNIPIFAWDGIGYLVTSIKNCCCFSKTELEQAENSPQPQRSRAPSTHAQLAPMLGDNNTPDGSPQIGAALEVPPPLSSAKLNVQIRLVQPPNLAQPYYPATGFRN